MRLIHCAFLAIAVFSMMSIVACDRSAPAPTVTLYSSIDGTILREVVAAYEAETGVTVNVLGDTEATKTTGLVERVLAERDRPRADAWWSSEPFGTLPPRYLPVSNLPSISTSALNLYKQIRVKIHIKTQSIQRNIIGIN